MAADPLAPLDDARYLGEWLHGANHYRMQLLGDAADNPDQRITDDIKLFVEQTLALGIGLLSAVVTLASFVVILWGLSNEAPLHMFGNDFPIPGYLVWGALIYALFGTLLTHLIGWPLVSLNFQQQRFEADFRFNLVRVRENSEQIALLHGEPANGRGCCRASGGRRQLARDHAADQEADRLHRKLFAGLRHLSLRAGRAGLFRRQDPARRHDADRQRLRQRAGCAVVFHRVLPHTGRMASGGRAPRRVRDCDRQRREAGDQRGPIDITSSTGSGAIDLRQLLVRLPNGIPLVSADSFSLRGNERTLITGPSGAGKSTLFRAIAGIWPFGTGSIVIPAKATLMMLPQRPYFPVGPLQAAIVYPAEASAYSSDQVRDVLISVGLPKLASRLEEEAHWNRMLSLGEQQRLGLARALLHAPQYLFLDEATASLDEASEAALYRLLEEKLPATTIVSIGHRSTLEAFHQRNVVLARDGDRFALQNRSGDPEPS